MVLFKLILLPVIYCTLFVVVLFWSFGVDNFLFHAAAIAAPFDTALVTELLLNSLNLLSLSKIKLVCPVQELSSAESGSYSTELLEVNKSLQQTGCNRNTMLRARDTLRAAGLEREGRARGETRNGEKC